MTIRGGGNPTPNMAPAVVQNGPAAPELAADAHERIMGPDLSDPPNTRLQGRGPRQSELPSDRRGFSLTGLHLTDVTGQADVELSS
jgi:hypothetical protein